MTASFGLEDFWLEMIEPLQSQSRSAGVALGPSVRAVLNYHV